MGSRQRREAARESLEELSRRVAGDLRLVCDGLNDSQRVLDPMRQLAEQQLLAFLQ